MHVGGIIGYASPRRGLGGIRRLPSQLDLHRSSSFKQVCDRSRGSLDLRISGRVLVMQEGVRYVDLWGFTDRSGRSRCGSICSAVVSGVVVVVL